MNQRAAEIMADINDHRELVGRLLDERRTGKTDGCGEIVPGIWHRHIDDCIAYERSVIERVLRVYWAEREPAAEGNEGER